MSHPRSETRPASVPFRIVDVINVSSSTNALLRERVLAMRASGLDNRIACADGPYVASLRADGIPVHTAHLPRGLDPVRLLASLIELTRLFRRERVDLVHTHCSVPGAVARVAAWLARVPVVVHTVHGFHFVHPRPRLGRGLAILVERLCGFLTHALLTQNREDLELAHHYAIGPAGARRQVGNGIDVRRFRPGRPPLERSEAPAGVTTITCVARLEPVKRHETLLEAAAILKRRGERFRLRLVGDGPLRVDLEARCLQLGIGDDVEFLGRRDDVPEILAGTDIAVLTSLKEGLPRAVLEPMACGVPVVATLVPGTREAVRHGSTGLLVEPDDPDSLAGALAFLIGDPETRARMGAEGRRVALAEFDERTVIHVLRDLYAAWLQGRRPRALDRRAGTRAERAEGAPAVPHADPARGAGVRVARNFSFRVASQALGGLVNLAGLVLLGRRLSADGYGEYAFYYSLIPLLAAAADAGVGLVATREIARRPSEAAMLLRDAIGLRLALSGLLLAGVVAASGQFLDSPHALLVAIVAAGALLDFGQDPAVWMLRARERLDVEGLLWLVSQGVWLGLLALGASLDKGLAPLLAAAPLAFAVRAAVGWSIVWRHLPPRRPRSREAPSGSDRAESGAVRPAARERLLALLVEGAPFGVAMFAAVLYGRVGVLLLKAFATRADVAWFNAAYLLSQPLGFVASALGIALFPLVARRAAGGEGDVRSALHPSMRGQLLLAFPLAVGLVTLADPIVSMLFHGAGFAPAGTALRWIGAGVPLIFFNLVARYLLPALDRQRSYLRAVALGLLVNTGMGLALIPRLGYLGACFAYLAAELAIALACQRALAEVSSFTRLVRDAVRPLVAAAGMAAVILSLRSTSPVLAGTLGVAGYATLLWQLRAFSAEDLALARGVWRSFVAWGGVRLAPRAPVGPS